MDKKLESLFGTLSSWAKTLSNQTLVCQENVNEVLQGNIESDSPLAVQAETELIDIEKALREVNAIHKLIVEHLHKNYND